MSNDEINKLIDKYLDGKTTREEEQQLALAVSKPDAPEEWKAISEMLGELALGEAVYDHLMARKKHQTFTLKLSWGIAASVAVLLGWGIYSHYLYQKENFAVLYINGIQVGNETQALSHSTETLSELFSQDDTESSLYELFNPE